MLRVRFILFLILMIGQLYGQGLSSNENSFESNWNITMQAGGTSILSEVNSNFSSQNVMNHQFNWGINLGIAKMLWKRVDVGIEYGVSNYKGFNNNPHDVNMLTQHKTYNNNIQKFKAYPIQYQTNLTNFSVYSKYNFINFSSWSSGYIKLNMYLKMSMGIAFPSIELAYKDLSNYEFTNLTHPLYFSGKYTKYKKDAFSLINSAVGFNYQLSHRIFLSAETSTQFINTDNLDGVLNYNNDLNPEIPLSEIENYRTKTNNISVRFLLGLSYFFNFDTHRQIRENVLPWYSKQFRSYYSKFQRGTSKKDRQQQLPFFHEKLEEKKKK